MESVEEIFKEKESLVSCLGEKSGRKLLLELASRVGKRRRMKEQ